MTFRRLTAIILAVIFLMTSAVIAETTVPEIETDIVSIQKYGNLELGISAPTLLEMGYEYGDLLTVAVNGQEMVMPLGSSYSDVDNQQLICRAVNDGSKDDGKVILAINMGDLATTLGIAEKITIDEDPGFRWDDKVATPVAVTISMKEKGGYANEYMLHQLVRSNNREDYPSLTDEQYANFRNVATTGIGAWTLFRSSSPVNPELNRNLEADEALNNAGIRTVVNLADSEETMKGYEGYALTYYSQRDVIALNLSVDFSDDSFLSGLAEGFRFMASHEGPYLVHCTEGKDRAGITIAILECLMGAAADEVVADYMVTYYNYYGVEPETEKYDAIREGNIEKSLAALLNIEDIYQADLAERAERFLLSIGLDADTIATLKNRLSGL